MKTKYNVSTSSIIDVHIKGNHSMDEWISALEDKKRVACVDLPEDGLSLIHAITLFYKIHDMMLNSFIKQTLELLEEMIMKKIDQDIMFTMIMYRLHKNINIYEVKHNKMIINRYQQDDKNHVDTISMFQCYPGQVALLLPSHD
jgi:hypothetical protein